MFPLSLDLPGWTQELASAGGVPLITGFLAWWTGNRMASAKIRKLDSDSLSDRYNRVMDALEKQIAHLTELVEAQSRQITTQSIRIQQMENELRDLHSALNGKTRRLHEVLALLPGAKELYKEGDS